MKLNKFNAANMSHVRQKDSTLRIARKGANVISDLAAEAIGLNVGEKIALVQDEDNPEDWYLMRDEQEGFTLRGEKSTKHLSFNCAGLANAMLDALFENAFSATFKLVTEPNTIEGGGKALPNYYGQCRGKGIRRTGTGRRGRELSFYPDGLCTGSTPVRVHLTMMWTGLFSGWLF